VCNTLFELIGLYRCLHMGTACGKLLETNNGERDEFRN